jgi:hypothetical protein
MRILTLITIVLLGTKISFAQTSMYDTMKSSINESSLPLVNLTVDSLSVNYNNYINAEIEITDFFKRTDSTALTVNYRCQCKYRGGATKRFDKKSLAVKLFAENDSDLNVNLLGIRKENSWILDAMSIDRIKMRNRVCFDLWNELSHTPYDTNYNRRNGTKGIFVELFINGNYHGLYCLSDKIDRKLLDLKKIKVSDDGDDVTVRGLLYKGESWESGFNLLSYNVADVNSKTWNAWELQYPEDYPSEDTWQPLMDLIKFCSSQTSTTVFTRDYQKYFYKDNLLDYYLLTLAMNVGDNGYKNTFLSTVNILKGHTYLITPWDMDMSLGGDINGDYYDQMAVLDRYYYLAPYNRLYGQNIDHFREDAVNAWASQLDSIFSTDHVFALIDSYAQQLMASGAWQREREKWNENPVPLTETIYDELVYVKDWYQRNYDNLCRQFGVDKGIVSNTYHPTPGNQAVYTLDGRKVADSDQLNTLPGGLYIIGKKKVVISGRHGE